MLPGNACNTDAERLQWFRNFTGDVPFGRVDASCVLDPDPTGLVALDFSLQMKVVLQSVLDFHDVNPCAADPEIEAAAGLPEAVVLPQEELLVLERRSGPIAEQLSSGARQDATRRRSPAVDRLLGKDVADPAVVHLDDLHSRAPRRFPTRLGSRLSVPEANIGPRESRRAAAGRLASRCRSYVRATLTFADVRRILTTASGPAAPPDGVGRASSVVSSQVLSSSPVAAATATKAHPPVLRRLRGPGMMASGGRTEIQRPPSCGRQCRTRGHRSERFDGRPSPNEAATPRDESTALRRWDRDSDPPGPLRPYRMRRRDPRGLSEPPDGRRTGRKN